MKCKFCEHQAPDMPELRQHVRKRHPKQFTEVTRELRNWDHDHLVENQNACPICPH